MSTPDTRHIFDESGCINQPMLLAYQRNQLSHAEQHSIEQHLVDCELCSDALEGLALISHDAVLDDVRKSAKRLTRYPSRTFFSPRNKNYFLIAASVTIVAVSTYFVLNFTNSTDKSIAEVKMQEESDAEKNSNPPDEQNDEQAATTNDTVPPQVIKSSAPAKNNAETKTTVDQKLVAAVNTNAGKVATTTLSNQTSTSQNPVNSGAASDANWGTAQQPQAARTAAPSSEGFNINETDGTDSATLKSQLKIQNITFVNDLAVYDYPEKIADSKKKQDLASERALESPYETREEKSKDKKEELAKSKRVISYKEKLSLGLSALQNKEYQNALRNFDDLLQENDHDINALFYSGLANENMLHYSKAIEFYDRAEVITEANYFVDAAQWHEALCLIQLKETNDAKIILNNLKTTNGFYSHRASDKLKQLK